MNRIVGLIADTLAESADGYRCRVRFAASEPVFVGHFPGDPIVPGVLMLEGITALAGRFLGGAAVQTVREAKFRASVRPEEELSYHVYKSEQWLVGEIRRVQNAEVVISTKFTLADISV